MRARASSHTRRGGRFAVLCIAPAAILYVVFMIYPTIQVFLISLYEYTGFGIGDKTFVGLQNFRTLVDDKEFVRSFQNTILLLVVVSLVTLAGGLGIASVMTTENLRAKNLYRFVFYLPSVLSIVVIAAIFSAIYDQDHGLLNSLIHIVAHKFSFQWLGNQTAIMYSIAIAMIWQGLGYYLVMYMAGMSSIPTEIYEAASVDGAGRWRTFVDVTLPLVWGTVRTTLTFFILASLNLAFVLVHAMTDGAPDGASEVVLNYMYKQAYTNSLYGYGMAIGVVVFAFTFLLSLVISGVTRREVHQF